MRSKIGVLDKRIIIAPILNREVLGRERVPSKILTPQGNVIYNDWFENGRYGRVIKVGERVYYSDFTGKYAENPLLQEDCIVRLVQPMTTDNGVVSADIINRCVCPLFYVKCDENTDIEKEKEHGVKFLDAQEGILVDLSAVQTVYTPDVWEEMKPRLSESYEVREKLGIKLESEFVTNWNKGLVMTSYLQRAQSAL